MNWLLVLSKTIDFLAENWGNLLSGLGALLTVLFSWRAQTAATLAKEAAQTTKTKLQRLDVLSEIARLNGRIDDLIFRLDSTEWPVVYERANELRYAIFAINAGDPSVFSEGLQVQLVEAVSQFRNLANAADRVRQNPGSSPDIARYKRIVGDQKEKLVLAQQEARAKMEDQT